MPKLPKAKGGGCCKHGKKTGKGKSQKNGNGFIHNNTPAEFHTKGPKEPDSDLDELNVCDEEEDEFEAIKAAMKVDSEPSPNTKNRKSVGKPNPGAQSQQQCSNKLHDGDMDLESLKSIKTKKDELITRLKIYNTLLKFHKIIKEDQVDLYRSLQVMDELYLKNTSAILRLGFCSCVVHRRTSGVGDKLIQIHRKLRLWDSRIEEMCDYVQEPSNRKTTKAILEILNICESSKLYEDNSEFKDVALPEIVWDLRNRFLEEYNVTLLGKQWQQVKQRIREGLIRAERRFEEICLEFGVTRRPATSPLHMTPFYPDDYYNGVMDDDEEDETDYEDDTNEDNYDSHSHEHDDGKDGNKNHVME